MTGAPELFCFGLLEKFDVRDLAMLVAPRPIRLPAPSDRLRRELADLPAWYERWKAPHDPFASAR
jgi:hypothetical protein